MHSDPASALAAGEWAAEQQIWWLQRGQAKQIETQSLGEPAAVSTGERQLGESC